MMEKVEVTIQFTPEDLQLAYKLHFLKMNPFRSRLVLILGVLLVLLGFLLVFLQSIAGMITWISWFFVVYGILIVVYYYWRISRMGKAGFKKLIEFHHPFTFSFTNEGVKSIGKTAKSDNTWEHYQVALVRPEIILLYPNKLRFVLLPKKYFTDEEFEQLRTWVTEKVKCK
jgi:hypothetical protein